MQKCSYLALTPSGSFKNMVRIPSPAAGRPSRGRAAGHTGCPHPGAVQGHSDSCHPHRPRVPWGPHTTWSGPRWSENWAHRVQGRQSGSHPAQGVGPSSWKTACHGSWAKTGPARCYPGPLPASLSTSLQRKEGRHGQVTDTVRGTPGHLPSLSSVSPVVHFWSPVAVTDYLDLGGSSHLALGCHIL